MQKELGENLGRLRREAGMTQEQLAGQLGVSPQAVSRWELAQSYPDIELLPRLAGSFHVTVDALLGYRAEKLRTSWYEEKYRSHGLYWGSEVWEGCYDVLKVMPPVRPLRLLDVGCGEGQAAVFFARNGYQVSAFDSSAAGIEKGRYLAEALGTAVDFFQADLLEYEPDRDFDLIFSSGTLQYIPASERQRVICGWQAHTAPGGLHVLNVFVEKPFLACPPDWEATESFWQTGELFQLYADWKMERMEEVIFDCMSSGVPHKHCMDVMMARNMEG